MRGAVLCARYAYDALGLAYGGEFLACGFDGCGAVGKNGKELRQAVEFGINILLNGKLQLDKSIFIAYLLQLIILWPLRLAVRTSASHAGNTSSILVGVTMVNSSTCPIYGQVLFFCSVKEARLGH